MNSENSKEKTNTSESKFLSSFARSKLEMIATSDNAYNNGYGFSSRRKAVTKNYTIEKIEEIIQEGELSEQQTLSRDYFAKDGYYKQLVIYYATLLTYMGILIPNPSHNNSLSTPHIQKRYFSALDFLDSIPMRSICMNWAIRAIMDGSYYGVISDSEKNGFAVIDLPTGYAMSRFKDLSGNDIVEFDLSYFETISDLKDRKCALSAYPKVISKAYKSWSKTRDYEARWFKVPVEIGICFPIFDGRPMLLTTIPATIQYDEAVAAEQEREAEEIRKIIVQKIPHLNDGRLLFEPEEAAEIHSGTVGMMKGNKNARVLTTYADVDIVTSKTSMDNVSTTLDRIEQNIYAQGGTSKQIFASTGSNSVDTSITNDMALMMYFADKVSFFFTFYLNKKFGNSNISFKYMILPITWYNQTKYMDSSFKLASSGYSFLLPAMAQGFSQKDLGNIKILENDILKLGEKLIPLSSSYTQGANTSSGDAPTSKKEQKGATDEGGRPELQDEEKSGKTLQNEESIDKTGGS